MCFTNRKFCWWNLGFYQGWKKRSCDNHTLWQHKFQSKIRRRSKRFWRFKIYGLVGCKKNGALHKIRGCGFKNGFGRRESHWQQGSSWEHSSLSWSWNRRTWSYRIFNESIFWLEPDKNASNDSSDAHSERGSRKHFYDFRNSRSNTHNRHSLRFRNRRDWKRFGRNQKRTLRCNLDRRRGVYRMWICKLGILNASRSFFRICWRPDKGKPPVR